MNLNEYGLAKILNNAMNVNNKLNKLKAEVR